MRFGSLQLAAKRQGLKGLTDKARVLLQYLAEIESRDDRSVQYLHTIERVGLHKKISDQQMRHECFFEASKQPSCAAQWQELPGKAVLQCTLERLSARYNGRSSCRYLVCIIAILSSVSHFGLPTGCRLGALVASWMAAGGLLQHIADDMPYQYLAINCISQCPRGQHTTDT